MARPSKLTPARQATIVDALEDGATVESAALAAGIAPASYYAWRARGEAELERLDQVDDADTPNETQLAQQTVADLKALAANADVDLPSKARKADLVAILADELGPVPDEAEAPFVEFLEVTTRARATAETAMVKLIKRHAVGDWRAAAWYLERSRPDTWGRQTRHELSGPRGAPLQVEHEHSYDDPRAADAAHAFLAVLAGEQPPTDGD